MTDEVVSGVSDSFIFESFQSTSSTASGPPATVSVSTIEKDRRTKVRLPLVGEAGTVGD